MIPLREVSARAGPNGKVEMSPLSKVEMSPFAEAGGGRFVRGRFGDERDGAGAV